MRSFQDFGKEFALVWEAGVFGVSVGDVVTALLVVLAFLGIRRLFYRFVVTALKKLTKKTKTTVDDMILEAIEKPFELAFITIGLYVGAQMLPLSGDASAIYDRLIRSLIALMLFWAIFRSIDPLSSCLLYTSPSPRD